jgi:hypothetical protein
MNELSLEVIRRNVEFSRAAAERMRSCSMKFSRGESFWSIYSVVAYIFEKYEWSFELILNSERQTEASPRVETHTLVEAVPSRRVRNRTRVAANALELTA